MPHSTVSAGPLPTHGDVQATGPVGMAPLGAVECLRLLASGDVGRIVYTDGALPAVIPVNYAFDEGHIYVRTTEVSRLVRKVPNTIVAFEVDEVDRKARHGWSVVATGPAQIVRDPDRLAHVATLDLDPWAPGERNVVLEIAAAIVTGYEIARVDPA